MRVRVHVCVCVACVHACTYLGAVCVIKHFESGESISMLQCAATFFLIDKGGTLVAHKTEEAH